MKLFRFFSLCFMIFMSHYAIHAQNIDYESRINRFYGSDCGSELGYEEHTWNGWLSDNVNTAETYSGCIQSDVNGATTQTGTYAARNRYNVTAT